MKELRGGLGRFCGAMCVLVTMVLPADAWSSVIHTFDFTVPTFKTTFNSPTPLTVVSDMGLVATVTAAAPGDRVKQTSIGVGVFDDKINNTEKLSVSIAPESAGLLGVVVFETGINSAGFLELFVDGVSHGQFMTTGGASSPIDFSPLNLSGSLFEFLGVQNGIQASNYSLTSLTLHVGSAPEPGILALLGVGVLGIGVMRRRQVA